MNKKNYICNCVDYSNIFNNATDMAYAIDKNTFYSLAKVIPVHKKIKEVEYRQEKNLLILYDILQDIHYFYI